MHSRFVLDLQQFMKIFIYNIIHNSLNTFIQTFLYQVVTFGAPADIHLITNPQIKNRCSEFGHSVNK